MQIINLQAENVKALTAVEITPDGKPVIITGPNGAGKSSILDSIFLALTNQGLADPIRHGATKATVKLNLGEIVIERRMTGKGTSLTVTAANGVKVASPQAFLDGITGELTMDPLAFTRLKPSEQRDMLLRAAGVNVDDLDAQYKAVYDERTVANRLAAAAQSKWQALPDAPAGTPDKEVTADAAQAEVNVFLQQEEAVRSAGTELKYLDSLVKTAENEQALRESRVAEAKAAIAKAQAQLTEAENILADAKDARIVAMKNFNDFSVGAPKAPDAAKMAAAKAKVSAVSTTNAAVRQKQARSAAKSEAAKTQLEAAALDTKLAGILKTKADRLASAKFGVPGLTVSDEGVVFNSIMFEQLSTAQQIEVSTLLAMKQNPKLKIILIREGALIGQAIFARVCALAKEHGYQLWVERMQDNAGTVGLHIEQGHIVAINGQPTQAAEEDEEIDVGAFAK